MIPPRTTIRKYCHNMLKTALSDYVGDRVYCGKYNPSMIENLPCVNIQKFDESIEEMGGTKHVPIGYERTQVVPIFVIADSPTTIDESEGIEDRMDLIGRAIEKAFKEDRFFKKDLPGYSSVDSHKFLGLISGSCITGYTTDRKMEAETGLAVQVLMFEILYEDPSYNAKRSAAFESYNLKINRVGWDDQTTDPTLIEAEGDLT